ncbi:E3 ubiquitin-protein ligase DTX4 [Protopterus annectens]|uniref:E3 ubiquitin-protein ligase DTX4 n=1 Tax=Protopterus annectens TaxID=7888 RepID=UPI001CFA8266|nr:E3 ubiquitin-protein ligase DTX4 [Protopterus annectens]
MMLLSPPGLTGVPAAAVVWEWLNEHGRWRPYSANVSKHIEAVIGQPSVLRRGPGGPPTGGGSVVLGQADTKLSPYILDLQSMHQFRQDTGTIRPVRRSFYDPTSAPGRGIIWEWENDNGTWTPYDMDICITIQHAYEKQHPWVDLTSIGFCYIIDFTSMSQINKQTQRRRRIHRRTDTSYPVVMGTLQKSQSWPATSTTTTSNSQPCTCQQCLLVMSVKAATVPGSSLTLQGRKVSSNKTVGSQQSGTVRSPLKAIGGQTLSKTVRPQAASTPALSKVASSPRGANSNGTGGKNSQNYLNHPNLQRLAIAQSRALIAAGVPTVPVKNLNGSSPVHPALAGITGILMSAAGLPVCLTRPPKLVLHPPPVSRSELKPIPGISNTCRKTSKKQVKKGKTPEEVVRKYMQKVRQPPEEDCTICMERLTAPSGYRCAQGQPAIKSDLVGKLLNCGHIYHVQCLVAMYNNGNKDGSLQCPTCKMIYGVKTGTQPPGKMEYHIIPHSLPGHPDCKTIRIIYNIPPGIQGPEHPNPGKSFTARGFPRHCYLPDNEKGRKVLKLLLVAWDRRLIFTIGTSSTTGESDTVIWNEVHHKTEFGSNLTGHGYPDPNYLDNVLAELHAQGITEDSLKEKE